MDRIHIALTESHRTVLTEHGPYTLREDGAILDREGFTLTNCRPTPAAEETEWDRALCAVLNEVAAAKQST